MSDEEKEKQLTDQESAREIGVRPPEIDKEKTETLENVLEEQKEGVNKAAEIIEEQGEEYVKDLETHGASPKEKKDFTDREGKIEQSAEEAKEEYENSFRTPGDIESEIRATENQEDYNSSKIITKDNNMENKEQANPNLTKDEILNKAAELTNKIDNGYKKGMSLEETKKLKKQRDQLFSLLPEHNEGSENKEENVGKAADFSKEVLSEETEKPENKPLGVENKELSKEELSELEEIIKSVEAEIAFLPISTYTEKEKIDSINQQLAILGEILPKFNKAKNDERRLFRKANGLNERFLNLKENPQLLNSKDA